MRVSTLFAVVFIVPAITHAQPIVGTTYTYDLSTEDMTPGGFTVFATPHPSADDTDDSTDLSAITTGGLLNDGDLGDATTKVPFGVQNVLFANGTFAGFSNAVGTGLAPQPRVNIDLGGTFNLTSLSLYYLVEDSTSIYSPRPVPDDPINFPPPFTFNALTVSGSTDGTNYSELSFTNDFNPLTGLGGDQGGGAEEIRIATFDLTGNVASTLRIDVHTPWAFIFLSEYVVEGTAFTGTLGDFDEDFDVDGADFLSWQRGDAPGGATAGNLTLWKNNYGAPNAIRAIAAVPEPTTSLLMVLFALGMCGHGCRNKRRRII